MNKELIQKFLNKACWDEQAQQELEDWLNVEKFAELIVKECAEVAKDIQIFYDEHNDSQVNTEIWTMIKLHLGVE